MVTERQIAALKYLIFNAKDGTELSKRVLAYLIDQSEGMTRNVCLTLIADREGYTAVEIHAAGHGAGAMQSSNCTTHLSELLVLMGSDLNFSMHYGDFDPRRSGNPMNTAGQFGVHKNMPMRYTFWLSKQYQSQKSKLVTATREELEQIDLRKPGMYPTLEPA